MSERCEPSSVFIKNKLKFVIFNGTCLKLICIFSCKNNILIIYIYLLGQVHNIVLYPDKHSWCNATSIVQVVAQPGCEPVEVDNSVCVGACFSYSIPRTEPHSPGEVAPYCDSCQPSHISWKQVHGSPSHHLIIPWPI